MFDCISENYAQQIIIAWFAQCLADVNNMN